ncbi:amidase family protein [Actinomycetospora chibensis]|uniref:Amidase family protein n=1 Tax=Actinomycetospora chibensis TaxID=663606 RepID=A0ABV9RJD4_9PSEU|nr:amidase family protein [Actinomycetospora chibensis]MDD7923799.1 amidase family protein [Actinomycetospora chibensis]
MDPAALVADTPRAQAAALLEGGVSAVDLAAAAVAASRALDAEVNAFLGIDAEGAHATAQEADRRRAAGEDGPLLGVPIALKDDLDAAGHVTSWGTRSRRTPARADGPVVTALRRAGAVPIGRTTLPELALYGFTESAFSGITRNPLDPTRTSGGSSGGSAAAVAGGAVGIATASDGAGSIRIPAACCGLVGIKPGAGRTPGGGWNGLSVQGCLTRRVADSALYLDLVGDFPSPLATAAEQDPPPLRIGVDLASPVTPALPLDPDLEAAVRRSGELLAGLGHDVRDVRVRYGTAPAGFVARMLHGLATAAADVDDPALLETRTADVARIGRLVPDAAIGPARRQGEAWGRRVLADLDVDVLLTPPARGPAVPVGHWAGRRGLPTMLAQARHYAHTPAWNHTGLPAAVVPAGGSGGGLPPTVQIIVRPGHDARLVSVAAQLERAVLRTAHG